MKVTSIENIAPSIHFVKKALTSHAIVRKSLAEFIANYQEYVFRILLENNNDFLVQYND